MGPVLPLRVNEVSTFDEYNLCDNEAVKREGAWAHFSFDNFQNHEKVNNSLNTMQVLWRTWWFPSSISEGFHSRPMRLLQNFDVTSKSNLRKARDCINSILQVLASNKLLTKRLISSMNLAESEKLLIIGMEGVIKKCEDIRANTLQSNYHPIRHLNMLGMSYGTFYEYTTSKKWSKPSSNKVSSLFNLFRVHLMILYIIQ